MAKKTEPDSPNNVNRIINGTVIQGGIKTTGDLRIDGTLVGSINCQGKIVIGTTGIIEGDIICQNADISGTVKAKLTVEELLTLKATAKLTCDIITSKLAIEPGAMFTGTCTMGGKGTTTNKVMEKNDAEKNKEKKHA